MNNRGVCLKLALVAIVALSSESYVRSSNIDHPLKVMPVYPFCNVNEVSIVVFPYEWCKFTSDQVSTVVGNIDVRLMADGAYRIRATANRPGMQGFYGALMDGGKMKLATDEPIYPTEAGPLLKEDPIDYK